MFVILVLILFQNSIEINEKPIKPNSLSLQEYAFIKNTDDIFYWNIAATIDKSGKIIVFDIGNKKVKIFDKNNSLLKSFGKEGNGPGEFNKRNMYSDISVLHDLIAVHTYYFIHLFDYDGNHIKDIKMRTSVNDYIIQEKDFGFRLVYQKKLGQIKNKFVYKDYDKKGNFLKEQNRSDYKEMSYEEMEKIDSDLTAHSKAFYNEATSFLAFGDDFIQSRNGSYKFEILDNTMQLKNTYTKKFERFELEKQEAKVFDRWKKLKKERIKQLLKNQQELLDSEYSIANGYHSDITRVIGIYKDNIFLLVADERNNKDRVHVLNSDFEFLTELTIPNVKNAYDHKIRNDKLIVSQKNDEIGPFLKIFDIKIH